MAKLQGVKTLDMVNGEITKVAYNGAEYVKTDSPVQEGDLFLLTKGHSVIGGESGEFYLTEKHRSGDIAIPTRFLGNATATQRRSRGIAFRKVSASQPTLEDRVSTNEKDIESLKSDVAALKGEAKTEYVRIDKGEAKAGDFVKFDEAPNEYLTAGEYYEIYRVDGCGDPQIRDDYGDGFDTCDADDFEVYRKVSAAEPKPERLKVGDYARVVESGDILKIIETDQTSVPYRAEHLNGDYAGWLHSNSVVRATDEEVAEAKRKQAEEEERKRWAAIGRDVGEYKRGDVVQYLYDREICEVVDIAEDGRLEVATQNHGNCTENQSSIELVAPVEARFDRKDDE
ncbi:hypothetical protein MOB72_08230 [Bacillus licheniformis]|uniref:hypothetical protein n=1 Tax=Bacillus licheniformis TaxID=1402 RepID=UPI00227DE69E|nr:hypothetical protein [Bacillus licheniformis]MCY7954740.1 hypothetical protein [Bacillus licheniformis]MCY9220572.1 hypothetical protein [Bacillus licheniformis]MEC1349133.1 hypothetical protein [Bacillus licheniformis]